MASKTILPKEVKRVLNTASSLNQRTVLLTCGISGSGKSTLARNIVEQYPNFVTLSIDKYIFERYGVWGRDYKEDEYEGLQDEAHGWVGRELGRLIGDGERGGERDVVLDLSFWCKEERERWRRIVKGEGGGR